MIRRWGVLLLAAGLLAAPAFAGETAVEAEESGQNPVMNFVGHYGSYRANMFVECEGEDEAKITVSWAGSAAELGQWEMSGALDTDTLTVAYDDCKKTDLVFNEDGEVEQETVEYENGTGRIIFHDDGELTLTWEDDQEHIADGSVFTYSSPIESKEAVSEGAGDEEAAESVSEGTNAGTGMMAVSSTAIEDGIFTVWIDGETTDAFHWGYERPEDGEEEVIQLITQSDQDGHAYAGSFRAIGDGEETIVIAHTNGVYADEAMTFDLKAEGGQIVDHPSGGHVMAPTAAELADVISGEWIDEDGMTLMNIALDEKDGLDFQIVAVGSGEQNAVVWNMTAFYDCLADAMIYDDGVCVSTTITGEEEEATTEQVPSETLVKDSAGAFYFDETAASEEELAIYWEIEGSDMEPVRFVRAEE